MATPSKEDELLKLILENSPLKHWHFKDFIKETTMTKAAINKWLKRYEKQGLIKKKHPKGKYPFYTPGSDNTSYISKKRIYQFELIYKSGLIEYLFSKKDIKTVIIFGSIVRGDWHKKSDIDIFIFGNNTKLDIHKFEIKLKRNIEIHLFKSKREIKEVKTGIMQNIVNGLIIKGRMQDIAQINV